MKHAITAVLVLLALATPAGAEKAPKPVKIPKDAPLCPPPDAAQIFIAPSGEPFRAPPGAPYPVAEWFTGADADRDGRLTHTEFAADAGRFFRSLDTNGNGEIAPAELSEYEDKVAPEISIYRQQRAEPIVPPGKKRPAPLFGGVMGAGRFGLLDIPNPIAAADADFNRGTSRAEFATAANEWFGRIDKAKAGALMLAALPQTPFQVQRALPCRPRTAPPPR